MFGWITYPITVFYYDAFCNDNKLKDVLDGLAAGITAISSAAMVVFAILTVRPEAAFFGLALVGVCAGFLRYNFHPASIFMGDSGSILLGMSLGVVSLFATTKSTLFVSLLMPIIVAGVPVIDTAAAIIRRKRQHQSVMQADRGHIHHRLLSEGYSRRSTVLIMWGWTYWALFCSIITIRVRLQAKNESMSNSMQFRAMLHRPRIPTKAQTNNLSVNCSRTMCSTRHICRGEGMQCRITTRRTMSTDGINRTQEPQGQKLTPIGNRLEHAVKQLRNPASRSNTAAMPTDMPQGNAS